MLSVVASGLDELSLQQDFTAREGFSLVRYVSATQDALREAGFAAHLGSYSETGAASKVRIPGLLTLTFLAPGNGRRTVFAYILQEALHDDPGSAYRRAERALAVAYTACRCPVRDAEPPPAPTLRSLDLHVDVAGWRPGRTTPGRFCARLGHRLRTSLNARGKVSAFEWGKFCAIYNKSEELTVNPHKGYIRDVHTANGWTPDMGPVWRIEYRFDRSRLLRLCDQRGGVVPSLLSLWHYALEAVSLHRRKPGSTCQRLGKQPLDPLWRLLHGVSWSAPWEMPPGPPARVVLPRDVEADRLTMCSVGMQVSALRLRRRQGDLRTLLHVQTDSWLERHPQKAADYEGRLRPDDEDDEALGGVACENPPRPPCPTRASPGTLSRALRRLDGTGGIGGSERQERSACAPDPARSPSLLRVRDGSGGGVSEGPGARGGLS